MRSIRTADGRTVPQLGLGTWRMGERPESRQQEVAALQDGLDLGMTVIDTAEMYGDGGAEEVVGEAIRGRRAEVYVITKVLPSNASFEGTLQAAERSLERLGTDVIDLYLLHWMGEHPVEDTVAAFEKLREQGKVLSFGVSNFDTHDLLALLKLRAGASCVCNQVLYNLQRRGVEKVLLPVCRENGVFVMAYSPLEQGRLEEKPALHAVAQRHGVTPAQVALAWTLRHEHVMAIPKAGSREHLQQNRRAADLNLTAQDLARLQDAYPPPSGEVALETI